MSAKAIFGEKEVNFMYLFRSTLEGEFTVGLSDDLRAFDVARANKNVVEAVNMGTGLIVYQQQSPSSIAVPAGVA
jgi:hypothetical protein